MKKLFVTAALVTFTYGFSQTYYYDDYRKSIIEVNWDRAGYELGLTPTQIAALNLLNNRYPDYDSWNSYYGDRPDNWRTDRYGEIERILGREKYENFKHKYYKGQNPVAVYNRNKNNNIPLTSQAKNDYRSGQNHSVSAKAKANYKGAKAEKGKVYRAEKANNGKSIQHKAANAQHKAKTSQHKNTAVHVNAKSAVKGNSGLKANVSAGAAVGKGNGNGKGNK